MDKICSVCGTKISDGAQVCPLCRTAVTAVADGSAKKKKGSARKAPAGLIVFLSIMLVLVFAGYAVVAWFRYGNLFHLAGAAAAWHKYENTLIDCYSMEEYDGEKIFKRLAKLYPEEMWESEEFGLDNWEDELEEYFVENEDWEEYLEEVFDDDDYQDYLKSKESKVVSISLCSDSDCDSFEDAWGFKPDVLAEIVVEHAGVNEDNEAFRDLETVILMKVDGKWYVYATNCGTLIDAFFERGV